MNAAASSAAPRLRFELDRGPDGIGRRLLGLPAREPDVEARLIDLSAWYNGLLNHSWHDLVQQSDLASLPTGKQSLAGVPFDIRGVVQVDGTQILNGRFPRRLCGGAVAQVGRLRARQRAAGEIAVARFRGGDARQGH